MSVLPAAVVGQLDPETDRDAVRGPALGRLADDPLPVVERRVRVGRRAGLEVDVIGDRELGDPALERRRGVDVDRDVAVGREVGVEMRVERQVVACSVAGGVGRARSPGDEAQLAADPIECRQRQVELLVGVGGGHDRPDPRLVQATVGKTTGWAKTPSSKSRSLNRAAVSGSPIMTGVIGVSDAPGVEARAGPARP